jgi:hypothetical protein
VLFSVHVPTLAIQNITAIVQVIALVDRWDDDLICWQVGKGLFAQVNVGGGAFLLLSNDKGVSWEAINREAIPAPCGTLYGETLRISLPIIFTTSCGKIFKSEDAGNSFTDVSYQIPSVPVALGSTWVSLGNEGLFKYSHDNGQSWNSPPRGITSTIVSVFAQNEAFIVATDSGVFRSIDGANWKQVSHISGLSSLQYEDSLGLYWGFSSMRFPCFGFMQRV